MKLDRATFLIFGMVASIVFPSVALWQRQESIQRAQVIIARARVDSEVAACKTLNEIPAAIMRSESPGSPVALSDFDRLALRGWLERVIATEVDHPRVCSVRSLHLQDIVRIADR